MQFTSPEFPAFLILCWVLYYCVPARHQNLVLLAASGAFYAWWDWRFVPLLGFCILVNYAIAWKLAATEAPRTRNILLVASITASLGTLAFFKYANFFIDSTVQVLQILSLKPDVPTLNVILPVGISFYTFQTLSYVIDVHQRKIAPTKNLIDFSVYVSFFPQLVAGPIERATHFLPQVQSSRRFSWKSIRIGFWLILIGYFQKVVVADNLAVIADQVFDQPNSADGAAILVAVYAFAFQIYGDFAGYSNIARGIARLFGFDLMINFRQPYLATNPRDFWSRWHISLSTWLRDYLYIPLGGNRRGELRTHSNLMATMVLGGLWHGASINFVLWGAWQGMILSIHRVVTQKLHLPTATGVLRILNCVVFFHIICFGWILFRVQDPTHFVELFRSLAEWKVESAYLLIPVLVFVLPMLSVDTLLEFGNGMQFIHRRSLAVRCLMTSCVIFALITMGRWTGDEFIYFQF